MLSDLSLFACALGKLGILCGFIPSILIFYAAEMLAKAFRVPARKQGERWLVWGRTRLKAFLRSGEPTTRTKSSSIIPISSPIKMAWGTLYFRRGRRGVWRIFSSSTPLMQRPKRKELTQTRALLVAGRDPSHRLSVRSREV